MTTPDEKTLKDEIDLSSLLGNSGRQIKTGINRKKFQPFIERCLRDSRGILSNENEVCAFCLWMIHKLITEKNSDGLTREDVIGRYWHHGESRNERYLKVLGEFKEYMKEK